MAVALLLGGVVGLERELADKPAGTRTHMLVAGAAALLVGLSDLLVDRFGADAFGAIQADPIRVVEAVVTGVSFLGAGTIIRRGSEGAVEGLTTAASLLFTAAIGISVGLSAYLLAALATGGAWVTLRLVGRVEKSARRR